jgi:hypothetical protein
MVGVASPMLKRTTAGGARFLLGLTGRAEVDLNYVPE